MVGIYENVQDIHLKKLNLGDLVKCSCVHI